MRFTIVDELVAKKTVTVLVPSTSIPDTVEAQTFVGLFRVMPDKELRRLDNEAADLSPEERRDHEHDFLRRVLVGWEGVTDPSDAEIAYGPEALDQALQYPWFPVGVYAAYRELISGEKARLGN